MTVSDIVEQARALTPQERIELVKHLIDLLDTGNTAPQGKTGTEIANLLAQMEPVEFVDSHLEDPIQWVKAQRQKRSEHLRFYQDKQ